MTEALSAVAIAHPNIALVKYWGKRNVEKNLPAVDSLSLTLDAIRSRTRVRFEPGRKQDEIRLNGKADVSASRRISHCLNLLRERAGVDYGATVDADNDFPTGAGLASSASGFAALLTAATAALGLSLSMDELAAMTRIGSGSAPRSLLGGFVALRNTGDGGVTVRQVLPADYWPLRVIIAVTDQAPKATASRAGMEASRQTSPYYDAWVESHAADMEEGLRCLLERDFMGLAEVAESSCLKMHALMLATRPPLVYWSPATLACLHKVQELRREGVPVFFTIDAGPQLKAVCEPAAAAAVRAALASVPGVLQLIDSGLGPGAHCSDD